MKWSCFFLLGCLIGCARRATPRKRELISPTAYTKAAPQNITGAEKSPPSSTQMKPSLDQIREQADELALQLRDILETQGSQAMSRYLRLRADQGLRLTPLRRLFYANNGYKHEELSVTIPPGGEAMVRFANEQLTKSGVDFIQFKGIVDKTLPAMNQPAPSHVKLYGDWKIARDTTLPLIGFAVTIFEAGANPANFELIASLVRSFTVLALDLQFRLFSTQWDRVFSQNKSLITWRWQTASQKLHHLTRVANHLLDGTRGMTRAYVYSYIVNWGYSILLYSSQFLAARFLKPRFPSLQIEDVTDFSVLRMIQESWLVNTAYFLAFDLAQQALKTSANRGEMSETLRYQLDTVGAGWANFWRVVSFIPGMSKIGQIMLYSFGGIVTLPLVLKTYEAKDYARGTAHIFAENDGESMPISPAAQAFGDVYDYLPLSRNETLSDLLYKLKIRRELQLSASTKVYISDKAGY